MREDESELLLERSSDDEDDWENHRCCPLKKNDNFTDKYVRPLGAEFFGTALLVFCGAMSSPTGNALIIASAHALALMFLVIAFAKTSGAHLNPAVTLAVALSGKMGAFQSIFYAIAQLAGSCLGGALVLMAMDTPSYMSILGGTPAVNVGVSQLKGMMMEAVLTFVLITVFLLTVIDQQNAFAPIAVGFALYVDIIAGGATSGGAVNPARVFGPAVIFSSEGNDHWEDHWIYWIGPILGTVLAAILFRFILASPKTRTLSNDCPDDDDEETTLFEK